MIMVFSTCIIFSDCGFSVVWVSHLTVPFTEYLHLYVKVFLSVLEEKKKKTKTSAILKVLKLDLWVKLLENRIAETKVNCLLGLLIQIVILGLLISSVLLNTGWFLYSFCQL